MCPVKRWDKSLRLASNQVVPKGRGCCRQEEGRGRCDRQDPCPRHCPDTTLHVFLPLCSHGTLRTLRQSPAGRWLSCPLDYGVLKSQGSGHLGPQHSALPLDHKLLSINEENEAQEVLGGSPKGPTRRRVLV